MKHVQQTVCRSQAEFTYNIPCNFEVDMLEYNTSTVIQGISGHPDYRESLAGMDIINKLIIRYAIPNSEISITKTELRHKKFHLKYYVCQNNTCHILFATLQCLIVRKYSELSVFLTPSKLVYFAISGHVRFETGCVLPIANDEIFNSCYGNLVLI